MEEVIAPEPRDFQAAVTLMESRLRRGMVTVNWITAGEDVARFRKAGYTVDGPIPEMRIRLSTALAVSLPLGVITVFLMSMALKARAGKRVSGMEGMVGETGTAQTPLSPAGKIFVHGELWDATASSSVALGGRVVVRRVDGLRLDVDPVSE